MSDDSFTTPAVPRPPAPVDATTWSIWLQYERLLDDRERHAEYMAGQRAAIAAAGEQTAALRELAGAIRAHIAGPPA